MLQQLDWSMYKLLMLDCICIQVMACRAYLGSSMSWSTMQLLPRQVTCACYTRSAQLLTRYLDAQVL